jgi:hypothetical protein
MPTSGVPRNEVGIADHPSAAANEQSAPTMHSHPVMTNGCVAPFTPLGNRSSAARYSGPVFGLPGSGDAEGASCHHSCCHRGPIAGRGSRACGGLPGLGGRRNPGRLAQRVARPEADDMRSLIANVGLAANHAESIRNSAAQHSDHAQRLRLVRGRGYSPVAPSIDSRRRSA